MKMTTMLKLSGVLAAATLTFMNVRAAEKTPPVVVVPLTEAGQRLEARYAARLEALKSELSKAVPAVDEALKAAFLKAYQDEATATSADLGALRTQGGKGVKDKDAAAKAFAEAKAALALAATNALAPSKAVLKELQGFLASDALDAKLAECIVLMQATPRGLAEYAQQGPEREALVEKLLADAGLLKEMLVAGGASEGRYGQAMEIYTAIQKASPKASDGLFQRLALGISLEHAVPVAQRNAEDQKDGPANVDPVGRYLYFEKAFLAGELDPGFKELTAWDYRMVVDGEEPDSILTWGREMLRNYRPDHISTPDFRWRYVKSVKTDVQYGSADQKFDRPSLQFYQNIINTGGVCGRRAFFGRYILRCFGIPTVARPQKGHAALAHWTPDGWVINLGAGWEWGWTKKQGESLEFLAVTQARDDQKAFLEVLRAQWVGNVLGESQTFGFYSSPSGFWNGVALYRQRAIIEALKSVALAAVGQDIAEANVSKEVDLVEHVVVTDADKQIVVGADGTITLPAVACTSPTTNTETVIFMKSALGGMQLHYGRIGKPETVDYAVDVPTAGTYALSARVVTVSPDLQLSVMVNDAKEPVEIVAPYTVGMWDRTAPVEVSLAAGKNVLRFSRNEKRKGMTIKDFTLTPMKK